MLTIFGEKITNFDSFYSIWNSKLPFFAKNCVFDPQNGQAYLLSICIFTAVKNHTNNFADTPFGLWLSHTESKNLCFFNVFLLKSQISANFSSDSYKTIVVIVEWGTIITKNVLYIGRIIKQYLCIIEYGTLCSIKNFWREHL